MTMKTKKISLKDALISKYLEFQWTIVGNDYSSLWWPEDNDIPPPTEEELIEECQRLQQEYENSQYQRDRAVEYPTIEDQLDILYHQGYDGWKEKINKIKDKYPKPE
jgi:hypothetical protein